MIIFRVASELLNRKVEAADELLSNVKIYVDGPFVDSEGETVFGRCKVITFGSHYFIFDADGEHHTALVEAVEYFTIEGDLKTF